MAKKASPNDGRTNRILSLWRETQHVAVVSAVDDRFVKELKLWALQRGYRVIEDSKELRGAG